MLLAAAIAVSALATAQVAKTPDVARTDPAQAPVIRVSENTVINYAGGTPATFTGAIDGDDSTYNRATTCGALSGVGTAAAYDTITITNTQPGTADFVVTSSLPGGAACGNANDTFFTLYSGAFNPASPLTGCLAVSDDISGATNRCSRLTFPIPPGETRVLVVAGFNNAAATGGLFDYEINFGGTVPVELMSFDIE
jgi:hypothetical protein